MPVKDKDKDKAKHRLPEWAPEHADAKFATKVVSGNSINTRQINQSNLSGKTSLKSPNLDTLKAGILAGNRTMLSKGITLIESNSHKHFQAAQDLIQILLPYSGKSVRIGITGVPGVGKSTFIETFGTWLISQGHKVAVLAIDPSSSISKGSILGDKTRMEKLSRLEGSFIRPSPSSGVLGGVARKTRETMIAFEAAGYDVLLVETVGVGQSEITARSIVDFFLLLQLTGAGDELQNIKKGIIELADLIVINKADGDNVLKAESARHEIEHVLHFIQPATQGWKTRALTCSALNGMNVPHIWEVVSEFVKVTQSNSAFEQRRNSQKLEWLDNMLSESLHSLFFSNKSILEQYDKCCNDIIRDEITPTAAVEFLMQLLTKND